MRSFLNLILALTITITPLGCVSSGGGGGGGDGGSGSGSSPLNLSNVTLSFNLNELLAYNKNSKKDIMLAKLLDIIGMPRTAYAAGLYEYVTSLYIKVAGPGMTDIVETRDITNPSNTFSISLIVPNGSNRLFEVKLKDRNNNILYSGNLAIDVGSAGVSQNIAVYVNVDSSITSDDYVTIGRNHLKTQRLELAYTAFDTAICLDNDHPVARFFRGFTHLLLLIQKDDATTNVASPNADIASMLNLYSNVTDIYSTSIAPDIYNENYDQDLENFYDTEWVEPQNIKTDSEVNVLESVILPEIDKIIADLAKSEADSVFSTTLTTDMHFGLSSVEKIDRGDIYILEAIAYGLKFYYNNILAYQMRTDANYWRDEFDKQDKDEANYKGLEYILDNDPANDGEELFDFTGGASTYLSKAKSALSTGLDKLKAGLQFAERRSIADKEAEDHIFNIVDIDDNVNENLSPSKTNIEKIITNIDEVKSALSNEVTITGYNNYDDASTQADSIGLNFSKFFSTSTAPNKDSLPEFYYHSISKVDMPILDTNNPESSSSFVNLQKSIVTKLKKSGETEWEYFNTLEDFLRKDMVPEPYKFTVPQKTIAMTGNLSDFTDGAPSIKPVMLDKEDNANPANRDIIEIYTAKDSTYLYIGFRLRGTPYTGAFASGEYLNYHVGFNCSWYERGLNRVPVTIELGGSPSGWKAQLYSYGENKGVIAELGVSDAVFGDIVELRLPLSYIVDKINLYEPSSHFPGGIWDGKEVYVSPSLWSNMSGTSHVDSVGEGKLAKLN